MVEGALLCILLVLLVAKVLEASRPMPRADQRLSYKQEFAVARRYVLRRDGYRCRQCGATRRLNVHHIVPRSRGGSNHPSNLITLCRHHHGIAHGQRWQ